MLRPQPRNHRGGIRRLATERELSLARSVRPQERVLIRDIEAVRPFQYKARCTHVSALYDPVLGAQLGNRVGFGDRIARPDAELKAATASRPRGLDQSDSAELLKRQRGDGLQEFLYHAMLVIA